MKNEIAVKIENIGKKYIIGQSEKYLALRDTVIKAVKVPFNLLKGKKFRTKKEFWALKDVSIEVQKGDVIGIIGRNGAGKSTLLKILSRITEPTEGTITYNGRVASLLEVGTGFHPELTGRENVFLNGAILGMKKSEIEEKFEEIVEFSGVREFIDMPVKRYSSGMQVRLAFSVAANLDSDILIIDEVLAVGDAEFQKKCLGKMDDVTKDKARTIFFVSHDLNAVRRICNKTMYLEDGRVKSFGETSDVIQEYLLKSGSQAEYVFDENDTTDYLIKSVRIFNSLGEKTNQILNDESFKIEIEYKMNKELKGIQATFVFDSMLGGRVFSTSSPDSKLYLNSEIGTHKITYTFPPHNNVYINPGTYILNIGLGLPNVKSTTSVNNVIIEIIDSSNSHLPAQPIRKNDLVLVNGQWSSN